MIVGQYINSELKDDIAFTQMNVYVDEHDRFSALKNSIRGLMFVNVGMYASNGGYILIHSIEPAEIPPEEYDLYLPVKMTNMSEGIETITGLMTAYYDIVALHFIDLSSSIPDPNDDEYCIVDTIIMHIDFKSQKILEAQEERCQMIK